jgi:hypothetical protein
MQKYNLQKNPLKKKTQNPSRYYYNSIITNLKFQTQSQNISCFKNPHIKKHRPINNNMGAKIPLSYYYTLYNNEI